MQSKQQYHILNGDSLKAKFPENIKGSIIVARECLVDGNVHGDSLGELFHTRATFISSNYGGDDEDYYQKTVPEFEKILNIENGVEINLWFEDDLFCQVNLWFVISLLNSFNKSNPVYLIRPENQLRYGFGGLSKSEIISIYESRIQLTDLDNLGKLWQLYQAGNTEGLLELATQLTPEYTFLVPAVRAHIERLPSKGNPGRPTQTLKQIINELETEQFEPVFKEFCNRESIYGFGDLQVKRLLEALTFNQ